MGLDLVGVGLHVIKGAAVGSLGYLGGEFMSLVAGAVGFSALASTNLALISGGLLFVGYAVDKAIGYHEANKKAEAEANKKEEAKVG